MYRQYSAEEEIRIVLDGLRGEHSIAELCRRKGIAVGMPRLDNSAQTNNSPAWPPSFLTHCSVLIGNAPTRQTGTDW